MNLNSASQKISQIILAITLGLIVYPESAKAASSTLTTESLELSKPTLLVNSVQQVSMLVEASNTISSELTNDVPSIAIDNVKQNNYTIAKENTVTPIQEVTADKLELNVVETANLAPENSSSASDDSPSLITSSENPTVIVAQAQSVSIPVEVQFQPLETDNQSKSITIPVEFDKKINTLNTPNTSNIGDKASAITIPVIPSSNGSWENQQPQKVQETPFNVGRPTLISNTNTGLNQNFDRRNSRIINPPVDKNEGIYSPNLMSSVPIPVESYNPLVTPSAGQMVSPDLPQINSPDPYLPHSDRPFNGYIWPAKGVFTSGYGWRWGRMHRGIDIAAPVGTPVVAAADGEVISAGWNSGGFGNLVKIRHFDGTVTFYAHNSKINVRQGQFVQQGHHIANMGSTGFSTGPHLHFEVHPQGEKAVNPIALLPRQ
ncbi:MAG: M23 family metallopeptidase [Geminocystis sp. GBBB08]|nr:M23 family metallopeptidase [Geminocystis sp. GBBB08]